MKPRSSKAFFRPPLPKREGRKRAAGLLAATILVIFAPTGLGQAPGVARPRPTDLLKGEPFDRITLIDNTTWDVEPVAPRPLPPVDPKRRGKSLAELEEMKRKAEESRSKRDRDDPFVKKTTEDEDLMIVVHLLEGEPRDFKVKRGAIMTVDYFEDMLLAEGDRYLKDGDYLRAFERYQAVKARDPRWPGLDDRVNKLLFEEGSAALGEDNARGLRLLADLRERAPDYPELAGRLAGSYARRIDKLFDAGDYLAGRKLLKEMEAVAPDHPTTRSTRAKFVARAKGLVDRASGSGPAERVDRLAEAVKVWPDYDGLESAYRAAFREESTLTVGVAGLAGAIGPFPNSPGSDRVAALMYLPILVDDDEKALRGEVPGQLLANLEVVELGKGLRINLRAGPTWSDGSRPASAVDVARALADRASPASPAFDARWADLVERVEVAGESRVDVKLARPDMTPGARLLGPVGPAHAASDGWVSSVDRGRRPVGDGPYNWEPTTDGTTLLRASRPTAEPEAPRIRRLREVQFANPEAAVEALARGEISLLERVPPASLADLRKVAHVRVGRYATPSVHRIALDGRTPALRNRKLRRALSMAIDRKGLLEDYVLKRPVDEANAVSDGPFPKGSFVDSLGVDPLAFNPLLAKGLVGAARKELGGNPIRLTLEYPPIAEARVACPKVAEAWKLIGVEVQLVERPETELESGLRSGRRFDLAYRASRPSRPLHDAGPLIVPGYDAPPSADALASAASPRILQLLIDLDRAPETTSARALAQQVDRESRDELPVLPLWQVQDHYAWRDHLKGPAEAAESLYQGITGWEIEPWFDRDGR